jgi:hypothetical protein
MSLFLLSKDIVLFYINSAVLLNLLATELHLAIVWDFATDTRNIAFFQCLWDCS